MLDFSFVDDPFLGVEGYLVLDAGLSNRLVNTSTKLGTQHISSLLVATASAKTFMGVGNVAGFAGLKVAMTRPDDA